MFKTCLGTILLVVLLSGGPAILAQTPDALTNQDVIEMVNAKLPETTILLSVRNSPHAFSTSSKDLIALQKAGVPQSVMEAMLERSNSSTTGTVAPVIPGGDPDSFSSPHGVVALDGDQRLNLMVSNTGFRMSNRPGFLALGKKTQRYAVLPGSRAFVRITTKFPQFEVTMPHGIHPSQIVKLVILEVDGDTRESAEYAMTIGVSLKKPKLDEKIVPTTLDAIEGVPASPFGKPYRITPQSALEPGEYAIVMNGQFFDFGVDPH